MATAVSFNCIPLCVNAIQNPTPRLVNTGINSPTKSTNEGEWIVMKNKSKKKQDRFGKIHRFGKIG